MSDNQLTPSVHVAPVGPQLTKRIVTVRLPDEYAGFEFQAWVNAPIKLWNVLDNPPLATDEAVEVELAPLDMESATDEQITAARKAVAERNEGILVDALRQLIVSHNGWRDYDGTAFPPAQDKEFFVRIPTELLAVMMASLREAQKKLPRSLGKKKRR